MLMGALLKHYSHIKLAIVHQANDLFQELLMKLKIQVQVQFHF